MQRIHQWFSRYQRRILIVSGIAIIAIISAVFGLCITQSAEDFANQFLFQLSYSLLALIPTFFIVESIGKGLLRLKGRIDRGLKDKKILLVGDTLERNNVYAQIEHSGLFDKRNITNAETHADYTCTDYDLVILCFSDIFLKTVDNGKKRILNDTQTALLADTLTSIGNSNDTKIALDAKVDIVGLIVLCPPGSLQTDMQTDPFRRPFTVVVNQIGRMITDVFSLLTTLPLRNRD